MFKKVYAKLVAHMDLLQILLTLIYVMTAKSQQLIIDAYALLFINIMIQMEFVKLLVEQDGKLRPLLINVMTVKLCKMEYVLV
jgi:hypothetical protein